MVIREDGVPETEAFRGWLEYFPEIVALLVVLAGWILGRVASHLIGDAVPWINRISVRWGAEPKDLLTTAFGQGLKALTFWGILIISVVFGLSLLGGSELTEWLGRLVSISYQLLITLGILVFGHILGLLARSFVSGFSSLSGGKTLPRIAYGVVIIIAVVTALKHIGLDLTFITQFLLVIISLSLAGLGLAFALGAKTLVANLVAQGELQRYKPGDHLLIDGIEGTVQEIHRTGLVLSTKLGLASIPAARFAEVTVIEKHQDLSEGG